MEIHIQPFNIYVEELVEARLKRNHIFLGKSLKSPLNKRYFDGKLGVYCPCFAKEQID